MTENWYEFTGFEGNNLGWQPAVGVDQMKGRGGIWEPCPPHSTPTTFSSASVYRRRMPNTPESMDETGGTDERVIFKLREAVNYYANRLNAKFGMQLKKVDVVYSYGSAQCTVEIQA